MSTLTTITIDIAVSLTERLFAGKDVSTRSKLLRRASNSLRSRNYAVLPKDCVLRVLAGVDSSGQNVRKDDFLEAFMMYVAELGDDDNDDEDWTDDESEDVDHRFSAERVSRVIDRAQLERLQGKKTTRKTGRRPPQKRAPPPPPSSATKGSIRHHPRGVVGSKHTKNVSRWRCTFRDGVAYRDTRGDLSSRVTKVRGPQHGDVVESLEKRGDWISVRVDKKSSGIWGRDVVYWLPIRIPGLGVVFEKAKDESTVTKNRKEQRRTTGAKATVETKTMWKCVYAKGVAYRSVRGDNSSRVRSPLGPRHGDVVVALERRGSWINVRDRGGKTFWIPIQLPSVGTIMKETRSTSTTKASSASSVMSSLFSFTASSSSASAVSKPSSASNSSWKCVYAKGVAYRRTHGDLSSRVRSPVGPKKGNMVFALEKRQNWIRVRHDNGKTYWLPLRIENIGDVFVRVTTRTSAKRTNEKTSSTSRTITRPSIPTKRKKPSLSVGRVRNGREMEPKKKHEGWLLKNRPSDPPELWKRRYCIADKGFFKWDTAVTDEPTKRQSLADYSVRPMACAVVRPHTLCLWHPEGRVINLQAKSQESLRVWQSSLRENISIANKLENAKPVWEPDLPNCSLCGNAFGIFRRRHHCRNCGRCVCATCNCHKWRLPSHGGIEIVKVCQSCYTNLKSKHRVDRDLLPSNSDGLKSPKSVSSPAVKRAARRSVDRRKLGGGKTPLRSSSPKAFTTSTSDLQRQSRDSKQG